MQVHEMYKKIYIPYKFSFSDPQKDLENEEYDAHYFTLESKNILFRKAKITPKKIGVFVAMYKRNQAGITIPYLSTDNFDTAIISCSNNDASGLFIFNKKTLIQHNIITHESTEGKRGFRLYPSWSQPTNKQALKTQQWQLQFFINTTTINQETVQNIKNLIS